MSKRNRRSRRRRKNQSELAGGLFLLFIAALTHETARQVLMWAGVVIAAVVVLWLLTKTVRFFRGIRVGREPVVATIEELRTMSPYDFELKCAKMLERAGFKHVRADGGAGDLGADVTGTSPEGLKTVVQCKRYAEGNKVTSSEMQLFVGMAYLEHKADLAMYMTTSEYTRPARELGERQSVVLIDGRGIVHGVVDELREANVASTG